ncbi:MAG: biotin--[acetyl-CoA-carboxylase] ligase, partial [Acidimicrobiales bacterium]
MPVRDRSTPAERAAAASSQLRGSGLGPVEWVANTGSTNADLLVSASSGAAHGLIRVADHQDAGRGRRDRSWHASPGDALLMSVLLRPRVHAAQLGVVTAAVGVAAAEACHRLGFDGVGIKWPNDLVVGEPGQQHKLAGILAQSHMGTTHPASFPSLTHRVSAGAETSPSEPVSGFESAPIGPAVVVGMGLNVHSERLGAVGRAAVALADLGPPPDRVTLLVEVARRLARWLPVAESDDPSPLWAGYRALSATLGHEVRADLGDE